MIQNEQLSSSKLCDKCVHHDACQEGNRPTDTVVKHDTRRIVECNNFEEEQNA